MNTNLTKEAIAARIKKKLSTDLFTTPEEASDEQFYHACALVIKELMADKHRKFSSNTSSHGNKRVHYLSMEFLPGRSFKNNLYNLKLQDGFRDALSEMDVILENLFEYEPDAGLGNGGLGRLAACYLDGLATNGYSATGYCILYEYGIFKQKIVDGWQTELPDYWIPGGDVWLSARPNQAVTVRFGGKIQEIWEDGYHRLLHTDYTSVVAIPYHMYMTGYDSETVNTLRLFKAKSPGVDMERFNSGDYIGAFANNSFAESISKVLYPNDNHKEGKSLRLRQQYFLCAAAIGNIVHRHLNLYGSLDNFTQTNALQINDTHPVLAIPELMRVLLDECGYNWTKAWEICKKCFGYTNHTVMREALEVWDEGLVAEILPRVYSIIKEINERFCVELRERFHCDMDAIERMAIISHRSIRMANLAVAAAHSVNGVSKLHSRLITETVFADYYKVAPAKFKNVTNGIASRRWLYQSNPGLTNLLKETIGDGYLKNMQELSKFGAFANDAQVLEKIAKIKHTNKENFAEYIQKHTGAVMNPASIYDVQVKRLHEYKRQQMNALNILSEYLYIKDNPTAPFTPKTYIFGAKAAPGYYLARQIIKFICTLSQVIDRDPVVSQKLKVVYLEDYKVTLSELLMPASDISEQISLAGTEASGTGNMKLMLNGAITIGTLDGANVEISEAVGDDNIIIFGMKSHEVDALRAKGYNPDLIYQHNEKIHRILDCLIDGSLGDTFSDLHNALRYTDQYMTLADFPEYQKAIKTASALYEDTTKWSKMSLINTAGSGIFCADRAIDEYASKIWGLK